LPLALISHLIFDFFFPHWNPHIFTEFKKFGKIQKVSLSIIMLDCLTSLGFVFFFAVKSFPDMLAIISLFVIALFAVLPDVIEIPFYFFNHRGKTLKKIVDFQHQYQAKGDIIWGNVSQWGLASICLYFLLR